MITFKEWQNRFFPEMPSLMARWKASDYTQAEMDKITHEVVPEYPSNKSGVDNE